MSVMGMVQMRIIQAKAWCMAIGPPWVAGRTLSGQMEDPVARIRPSCNVVGGVWEILRQGRVTWEVVPDEMWPKWADRPQLLLSGRRSYCPLSVPAEGDLSLGSEALDTRPLVILTVLPSSDGSRTDVGCQTVSSGAGVEVECRFRYRVSVSVRIAVVQWTYPIDANRRPIRRQSELAYCRDAMLGRIRMLVRMDLLGLSRSQNRKARLTALGYDPDLGLLDEIWAREPRQSFGHAVIRFRLTENS
ncbi:hypothetical protein B0T13DRAFT_445537 [Neurospora crassa]|nr:hypothetical protein B0T13DRAFT_445537 [Neurospora crassa]